MFDTTELQAQPWSDPSPAGGENARKSLAELEADHAALEKADRARLAYKAHESGPDLADASAA